MAYANETQTGQKSVDDFGPTKKKFSEYIIWK